MTKVVVSYLRQHHVGLLALFFAVSGTAYAATLPRNSVGTAQLKKSAVTSAKVKDGSLLSRDFKAGQLPSGRQGPAGPAGPTGAQGPPGPAGRNAASAIAVRDSGPVTVANGATGTATVACAAGSVATGGGGITQNGNATLTDSFAVDDPPTTWEVDYRNNSGAPDTVFASAVCVTP